MCFLTEIVQPARRSRKTFLALNNVASDSGDPFKFVFFGYTPVRLFTAFDPVLKRSALRWQ